MAIVVTTSQLGTSGDPGLALENLVVGETVTLTASGGSGPYTWTMLDSPTNALVSIGSDASLSSSEGESVDVLPDFDGTYNGTVTSGTETVGWSFYAGATLGRISDGDYFPRRIPGFLEGLAHRAFDQIDGWAGNRKGWSREWRRWFEAINWMGRQFPRRVDAVALDSIDVGSPSLAATTWDDVSIGDGSKVLLTRQEDMNENGIYRVLAGALELVTRLDDLEIGNPVITLGGTIYRGISWKWDGLRLRCVDGPQRASPVVSLAPSEAGEWVTLMTFPVDVAVKIEKTVVVDCIASQITTDSLNYPPWRMRGTLTYRLATTVGNPVYLDDDALTHHSPARLQAVISGTDVLIQAYRDAAGGATYQCRARQWEEYTQVRLT